MSAHRPFADSSYQAITYRPAQLEHCYGDGVHILADPTVLTLLSRLCAEETVQPGFSRIMRQLYGRLIHEVVSTCFPTAVRAVDTRMKAYTERGVFQGVMLAQTTEVATVDVARAGILPSQVCFEYLCDLLPQEQVRQDHLFMSRVTDENEKVIGASLNGDKVGGGIDGRIVLFPDPMGATGSSLSKAIGFMKENYGSRPAQVITMNLIVTPQFIKRMKTDHPDVKIFALRLDRGMSGIDVLNKIPGIDWEEESGLTDTDYIVPGGGGFGELMNNAFV